MPSTVLSAANSPHPSMVKDLLHASNPVSLQSPAAPHHFAQPAGDSPLPPPSPLAPILDKQSDFLRALHANKGSKHPTSPAPQGFGGSPAAAGSSAQFANVSAAAASAALPGNRAEAAPGDRANIRAAAKAQEKKMRRDAAAKSSAAMPDPLLAQFEAIFEVGGDGAAQSGRIVKVRGVGRGGHAAGGGAAAGGRF